MRIGTVIVIAAALGIPVLNYFLFSLPQRMELVDASGTPIGNVDTAVHVTVRNCARYTQYTGRFWWKRAEVNYCACAKDASTEAQQKVIGEFKQPAAASGMLIHFTWACALCQGTRLLHEVKIPLGASSLSGPVTLNLPLDVNVTPENEVELTFTHGIDPKVPLTLGVPLVE